MTYEIIRVLGAENQKPVYEDQNIYISYYKAQYHTNVISKGKIEDEINPHVKVNYISRL